jgi:hypothetical protein
VEDPHVLHDIDTDEDYRSLDRRIAGFRRAAGLRVLQPRAPGALRRPLHRIPAAAAVDAGSLQAPIMSEWSLAAYGLDSVLGARPQPINTALKQALEWVGLEGRLRARGAASAGRTAPLQ